MNTHRINDLPCGALTHIASFLTVPSRALFAVAISTGNAELTKADELAIVGTEWNHILDFGEIHKDLAAKLTDGDIRGVLLSLDAVNRLTRVMLTGCIKITGAGLEPLRGSLVIEHIDLSPMKTSISFYRVLPILDSIIEQERCALKHLEFSRAWRSRQFPSATPFQQFISRYNEMWARRQNLLSCFKCSARLPQRKRRNGQWVHDVGGLWIKRKGSQFGIDRHTCYGCLKHYCQNCVSESGVHKMLGYCGKCNRRYCSDCTPILKCGGCAKRLCSSCGVKDHNRHVHNRTCPDCGSFCCDSCSCDECGSFCYNCNADEDNRPQTCEDCHETLCGSCRSRRQVPILKCVPPEFSGDDCWKRCSKCAPKVIEQICRDCGRFCCEAHLEPCESCGFFCHHCSEDDEAAVTCEECNERLCRGCRSQSGMKGIKRCSSCPEEYCNGCRVRYNLNLGCKECAGLAEICDGLAKIYLLEEKIGGLTEKNEELTKKNKELTNRNEELSNKNKELTDKNEQLRGKMKLIRKIEGKTEQHE